MAKGKKCPSCNFPMFARKEDWQDKGTWVTYECQNNTCPQYKRSGYHPSERVFEESPKNPWAR